MTSPQDRATSRNSARPVPELQARWQTASVLERAAWVKRVLEETSLSRRALARQLKMDEGSVRRYLSKAALSDGEKQEIATGGSVAAVLGRAKQSCGEAERQRRQAEESDTGVHSERLAAEVAAWLAEQPLCPEDKERILSAARQHLWHLRSKLAQRQRSGLPLGQIIAQSEPAPRADVFWMERYIEWVVRWLPLRCPEYAILDRALDIVAKSAG